MKSLKTSLVLACAAVAFAPAAHAGTVGAFEFSAAPNAQTAVAPISAAVTYAKKPPTDTLQTYVAFNVGSGGVLLKNSSGNTINNATLTFTAKVSDAAETLKLFQPTVYLGGLPGCVYPTAAANEIKIECYVRQFKAGDTFPSFTVFYEAPVKVENGLFDEPNTDEVRLDVRITYAEGTNGNNPRGNSVVDTDLPRGAPAILGTENPTIVKSAVPKIGGTFFSGVAGISRDSDRFSTTVTVPPAAAVGRLSIEETLCAGEVNLLRACWETALSIQDALLTLPAPPLDFAPAWLSIVVRQDAQNIVQGTRIESVLLYYLPDGVADSPAARLSIGLCASGPVPRADRVPCIAERKAYKNRSVPGWTTELDGDFEWTLINFRNGRIIFPS